MDNPYKTTIDEFRLYLQRKKRLDKQELLMYLDTRLIINLDACLTELRTDREVE